MSETQASTIEESKEQSPHRYKKSKTEKKLKLSSTPQYP